LNINLSWIPVYDLVTICHIDMLNSCWSVTCEEVALSQSPSFALADVSSPRFCPSKDTDCNCHSESIMSDILSDIYNNVSELNPYSNFRGVK
jgi:hypothetical protein